MKIAFIAIIIAGALIGGFVLFFGGDEPIPQGVGEETLVNKLESADKAPDFRFKDYEGNEIGLADFAGRNVILNSWAAWCPFCVQELKDFAALQEELGEKITIVGIDRAESLKTAKEYSDDAQVTGRLILLLDPDDSFYRSIGGFSMPETLFVDGAGNVLFHKRGPMNLEEMREKVNQLFSI